MADITLISAYAPSVFGRVVFRYVPVGVLSLASSLEAGGVSVDLLDFQCSGAFCLGDPDQFYRFLSNTDSNIIGLSLMAKDMPVALIACERLKRQRKSVVIILGGPGPTGVAEKIMERFPFIDYVVRGEGERPLTALMKVLNREGLKGAVSDIAGLVYRCDGRVMANPLQRRIEDLDSLPLPAYHLINPEDYNVIYLPTTRGCRHFCGFCDQPALWQGREVQRSMESLFDELNLLVNRMGVKWEISFSDNEFCVDTDRFEEFRKRYREGGYRFSFSMDRRIDSVDGDFFKNAREINCRQVLYGLESASDRILEIIGKEFRSESIEPGLKLSARYMNDSIASFIFNYPFETFQDFMKTVNAVYRLYMTDTEKNITLQLHFLSPLPRTPVYEKYKEKLIYQNVSTIMTASSLQMKYFYHRDEERNKTLNLPVIPGIARTSGIRQDVEEMIRKYPEVFPSFYIYDSPFMDLKKAVIRALSVVIPTGRKKVFFKYKKYLIFFDEDCLRICSETGDEPSDTIIIKIDWADLDKSNLSDDIISRVGPGRFCMVRISDEDVGAEQWNLKYAEKIHALLKRLSSSIEKVMLISFLAPDGMSYGKRLEMMSAFGMPGTADTASDQFYIGGNGELRKMKWQV